MNSMNCICQAQTGDCFCPDNACICKHCETERYPLMKRELADILGLDVKYLHFNTSTKDHIVIDYTEMYENPEKPLSLEVLSQLAKFFGTVAISVDDVDQSGCESCNWGSSYGHIIHVYGATQNEKIFV